MSFERDRLSPLVEDFRGRIDQLYNELSAMCHPNWYWQISFERRAGRAYKVTPRDQDLTERDSMGVMLRIFDGESMFESASDEMDSTQLKEKAEELVERVKRTGIPAPLKKVYRSPEWKERLARPLENEILCQIPKSVTAESWVHFGTPVRERLFQDSSEAMSYLKTQCDRMLAEVKNLASDDKASSPDFWVGSMRLSDIEFLFIDESVKLSQALYRNAIYLNLIKGEDSARFSNGGLGGRETLKVSDIQLKDLCADLSKMLRAERLTPGRYKLVMNPAISGVFAHEAFGHTQEADTWARGRSKARELYAEKVRVGNEHASIVNNPAVYQNGIDDFSAWGSYYFDEEGWLAEKQFLVKEGWLQTPMTNLTSALRLNVPRTANGKRESWMNGIYSRQTNTYFTQGDKTLQALLSMVDYGFLATACFGGMEDPKGMGIQVGMGFLEEIKDGRLTGRTFKGPNGGAIQMTGYVPDYLNSIIAKTKIDHDSPDSDQRTEPWNDVGGCGKYHKEFVVAGCGGPYMLVDNVLLA